MATVLENKSVVRELKDWRQRGLFGLGHGGHYRNLIMTIEPGNFMSFREKGLRKRYDIDIESVFNLAVRRTMMKDDVERRKVKKAKREAKRRVV